MENKLVVLKTFNSLAEAYVFKGRLESEGILCFLHDEQIVNMNPFYSQAVGGVKLKVPEDQIEEALKILEEGENNNDEN